RSVYVRRATCDVPRATCDVRALPRGGACLFEGPARQDDRLLAARLRLRAGDADAADTAAARVAHARHLRRERQAGDQLAQLVAFLVLRLHDIVGAPPAFGPGPGSDRHVAEDFGDDVVVFLAEFRELIRLHERPGGER